MMAKKPLSKNKVPVNLEFNQYLKEVLGSELSYSNLFIATENDFKNGEGISFPYRSYFYAFGILHEDHCRLKVGIREFDVSKQSLTIIGPGILRMWMVNNWRVKNTTVFFKPELYQKSFRSNFLSDYSYFRPGAQHVIKLSDTEYAHVNSMLEIMLQHRKDSDISSGLLFSLLELVQRIYSRKSEIPEGNRSHEIIRSFDKTLSEHYQEHKEVNFYADRLNITPKHLSDVIKKETGLTAKQSIEEFILFDAKSLLKQTDMTIKEIVYWLGYDDPPYFSKLFKNKLGMTPSEFRMER